MQQWAQKALWEEYIYDAFENKSEFRIADEASSIDECPRHAAGTCPYDILTNQDCQRIREAMKGNRQVSQ